MPANSPSSELDEEVLALQELYTNNQTSQTTVSGLAVVSRWNGNPPGSEGFFLEVSRLKAAIYAQLQLVDGLS